MTLAPSPELRPAPPGLPSADLDPPVVAESGDPFAALRVIDLVARLPRDRAIRLDELVDRLNARHLGWLFDRSVVSAVLVQLQSNWIADYRNRDGIEIEDGPSGPTVRIEDSTRVDPWIVGQAARARRACEAALVEFSRRDRATGE
ncbi:MAG TPA: hypothetical protein VFS32_11385 [Candidatus Limnocylindrales bacterium]|nr:hypothetical protein [Candidatus Limnocylindrales bacterium]